MFSKTVILVRIALANIFSSMLNVFVGVVLLFGAALLVVGGSLFSTLDEALSKSIVGSITGHLQVYGARSKDPLEIYGKVDGSDSQLTPLDDFKTLKAKLLAVPNVARVVPRARRPRFSGRATPSTSPSRSCAPCCANSRTTPRRSRPKNTRSRSRASWATCATWSRCWRRTSSARRN